MSCGAIEHQVWEEVGWASARLARRGRHVERRRHSRPGARRQMGLGMISQDIASKSVFRVDSPGAKPANSRTRIPERGGEAVIVNVRGVREWRRKWIGQIVPCTVQRKWLPWCSLHFHFYAEVYIGTTKANLHVYHYLHNAGRDGR